MNGFLRSLALMFGAGAAGALVNSAAIWAAGDLGLTAAIGVAIAPGWSLAWLYPRIVLGGLWGFLFLLWPRSMTWAAAGFLFSLAPTAYMLFAVFPERGAGVAGLELGLPTPLVVVIANALWGWAAAWILSRTGR